MYGLYSFMPVVVKMTSATAVNLSLLTADLFSLYCGIVLFHYNVSFGLLLFHEQQASTKKYAASQGCVTPWLMVNVAEIDR